jgi:hypothetical protein
MEKKQVQATVRTVIGYQKGYGRKRPAVVLDASTLWMESGGREALDDHMQRRHGKGQR